MNNQLSLTQLSTSRKKAPTKIRIKSNNCIRFIAIAEICSVEAQSPYSFLYMADGNKVFAIYSLCELGEILTEYGFIRLERSWLVNLQQLKSYRSNRYGEVILNNGQRLTLPRGKKREFQKQLNAYYL